MLYYDNWAITLNEYGQIDVVYVDSAKSFANVNHQKFLHKL